MQILWLPMIRALAHAKLSGEYETQRSSIWSFLGRDSMYWTTLIFYSTGLLDELDVMLDEISLQCSYTIGAAIRIKDSQNAQLRGPNAPQKLEPRTLSFYTPNLVYRP